MLANYSGHARQSEAAMADPALGATSTVWHDEMTLNARHVYHQANM
jgi:hypothetical protein